MFNWLQYFSDWLIYSVFGLSPKSHLGEALNFFVFDSLKIFLLLFMITVLMGIVNSYFPVEKVRNFLSRKKMYGLEYLFASSFGVITPFCSCSSVPLFIGFVKGGIPLGITFTYLITAPLVNEVAIAIFFGTFGFKVTALYVLTGILLGIVGGFTLGKIGLEKHLSPWVKGIIANAQTEEQLQEEKLTLRQRFPTILKEAINIVKGVSIYIVIGIAIGGAMHGFLPTGFFEQYINKGQWYAAPLAVIMGIPMYSNAAGVIPVVQVLVSKGVPLGTAIAFMMGVIGLSLPEAMLLKKVMTVKLIVIYFSTIAFFMILSGYLFNIIL
ncbi:MAG: permease [Bacteroidetes bacterium]|nr:permease [Bacteroidota bacterium]